MKKNSNVSNAERIIYRENKRGRFKSFQSTRPDKNSDSDVVSCLDGPGTANAQTDTPATAEHVSGNSAPTLTQRIMHRLVSVPRYLILCYDVKHERMQLSKMTGDQLVDLDLDRVSVNREARRGFFDIPIQRAGISASDDFTVSQQNSQPDSKNRRNVGLIIFVITGVVVTFVLMLLFGYVIALSVAAGFTCGTVVSWLIYGLRNYSNYYMDIRDTD